jgi:hypothetical protein
MDAVNEAVFGGSSPKRRTKSSVEEISEAVFGASPKRRNKSGVDLTTPEQLVEFEEADSCSKCGEDFTFFKRRHHCRHCGKSFCTDHCRKIAAMKLDLADPSAQDVSELFTDQSPVWMCTECERKSRLRARNSIAGPQFLQSPGKSQSPQVQRPPSPKQTYILR